MNKSNKNTHKFLGYVQLFFEALQYLIVIYAVFYVVRQAIEKAQATQDLDSKLTAYTTGAVLAVIIILLFAIMTFGIKWTEKFGDYLQDTLYLFPRWRRAILTPIIAISPWLVYWTAGKMETEITFKVVIGFYFFVFVNSSMISLIRDDHSKEKSPLSSYITRDVFLQDRQAALAKAFTVVEDQLAKKVGVTKNFSTGLINEAYQGDQSKLRLVIDGKDRTSQFRDFLAGAYSLLRNPRHHELIEDDLYTSNSIYAVAELLLEYVNASEKRE